MMHLESLICHACRSSRTTNLFDNDKRRAFVGSCGHSICLSCARKDPKRNCPICSRPNVFTNGTVNYGAANIIEHYGNNIFQVFRKWWECFNTGTGVCSNCLAHKSLRICVTCKKIKDYNDSNLYKYAKCEECAISEFEISGQRCESFRNYVDLENDKSVECRFCHKQTFDPKFSQVWFHLETLHLNFDTFNFCADCILEYHSGHETLKVLNFDTSTGIEAIRLLTVPILKELLKSKLSVPEDLIKCKLRHMRMILTSEELVRRAMDPHPMFPNEGWNEPQKNGRPAIPENYIEEMLSSLETQYQQLQNLESTCQCVEIWKDIVRLNIFDFFERCPHFHAMVEKTNLAERMNGCPFDFESSKNERESLLGIIEKGEILSEPHEVIWT